MNKEITSETEISERLINELAALPWGHFVIISQLMDNETLVKETLKTG